MSPLNNIEPTDPGCQIWDWNENICLECSNRWYFDEEGTCQQVDDLCKDSNYKGECTECYLGYELKDGICV